MTRVTHQLQIRWFGIPISFTRVVERPSAPAPTRQVINANAVETPRVVSALASVVPFPFRKSA